MGHFFALFLTCLFSGQHAQIPPKKCLVIRLGGMDEGAGPSTLARSPSPELLPRSDVWQYWDALRVGPEHPLRPYIGDARTEVDSPLHLRFSQFARVVMGGGADWLNRRTKATINIYRSSKPSYVSPDLIRYLKQLNIRQILSFDVVPYDVRAVAALKANDILYAHLPVPDLTGADVMTFDQGVHIVDEAQRTDRSVLIHCRHGIGRTGTFLTAYEMNLVLRIAPPSTTLDNFLKYVDNRQSEHWVETFDQMTALMTYAEHLWRKKIAAALPREAQASQV